MAHCGVFRRAGRASLRHPHAGQVWHGVRLAGGGGVEDFSVAVRYRHGVARVRIGTYAIHRHAVPHLAQHQDLSGPGARGLYRHVGARSQDGEEVGAAVNRLDPKWPGAVFCGFDQNVIGFGDAHAELVDLDGLHHPAVGCYHRHGQSWNSHVHEAHC